MIEAATDTHVALMSPSGGLAQNVGSDAQNVSIDAAELPRPPEATVVVMDPGPTGIADELPRSPDSTTRAKIQQSSVRAYVRDRIRDEGPDGLRGQIASKKVGGKLVLGPNLTKGYTSLPPWKGLKRGKGHKRWTDCLEADDIEVTAEDDSMMRDSRAVVQEYLANLGVPIESGQVMSCKFSGLVKVFQIVEAAQITIPPEIMTALDVLRRTWS